MMKQANDTVEEEQIHQSIIKKRTQPNNSGYLQQHYETTPEFPNLQPFHFRIEDQEEIMQLEKLRKKSEPINMETRFQNTSNQFQMRLNGLIGSIDANAVNFKNQHETQRQSFYLLADQYPDDKAIQQAMQKIAVKDLQSKVQNLRIEDLKPSYTKKYKNGNKMSEQKQVAELQKKISKISISFEDL